jgi:mono/diheme cytochrome c family protein/DNA-binding beta-propeller fold protein YncE
MATVATLVVFVGYVIAADAAPKLATEKQKAAWSTKWSEQVGVSLEYSFDSSGPAAWTPEDDSTVFITTEGPGYGGLLSGVTLPGLAIIDADSREIVASQNYDVLSWDWKNVFEPHGLGTSPDGKWIYLPTGEGSFMTRGEHAGRYLVINARTLKVDKVIKLQGQAHHAKSYITPEGEQRVILYGWSQPMFVLDPGDDNRVVGSITHQEQGSEGYLYFASPNGDLIIGTGRYRDFDMRKKLLDNPIWLIDPESWNVKKWISLPDSAPTWVNYTSDSGDAYITGSRNSIVMHVDLEEEKFVGEQRAGVDGPYGNHFGWDDRYIYTIGKGEESHNRGKMLGMVDADTFEVPGSRSMNQFYTACIRGDHGTLHPDPEANELWISCNASFEVAVFDLDLQEVTARIPLPNGGSTHSGAFVHYPDGWNADGETQSDQSGLWGSALQIKRDIISGKLGSAGSNSIVDADVAPLSAAIAEGRDVFRSVAGIGCASCHGKFAEGDLGVGPYGRGASEGMIRAAISGVGEMAAIKNVITEDQIKSVSAYLAYLGSNQVVRTLVKRGRFLPSSLSVRPGTNVQLIINNAGFSEYEFRSDNLGLEPMTIPARSLGTVDWKAPEDEGTYTIYCADCKLEGEFFTINVDSSAKAFKPVVVTSSLNP